MGKKETKCISAGGFLQSGNPKAVLIKGSLLIYLLSFNKTLVTAYEFYKLRLYVECYILQEADFSP